MGTLWSGWVLGRQSAQQPAAGPELGKLEPKHSMHASRACMHAKGFSPVHLGTSLALISGAPSGRSGPLFQGVILTAALTSLAVEARQSVHGGTRTRNLLLRGESPCPLGHTGIRNLILPDFGDARFPFHNVDLVHHNSAPPLRPNS